MLTWLKGVFLRVDSDHQSASKSRLRFPLGESRLCNTGGEQANQSKSIAAVCQAEPLGNRMSELSNPDGETSTLIVGLRLRLPVAGPHDSKSSTRIASSLTQVLANQTSQRRRMPLKLSTVELTKQLHDQGVNWVQDLAHVNLAQLVQAGDIGREAYQEALRWKLALRLRRCIGKLSLVEALWLVHVHRSTVETLACAKPARLQADLERFGLTTTAAGLPIAQRQLTRRRIRYWIERAAEQVNEKQDVKSSTLSEPLR